MNAVETIAAWLFSDYEQMGRWPEDLQSGTDERDRFRAAAEELVELLGLTPS